MYKYNLREKIRVLFFQVGNIITDMKDISKNMKAKRLYILFYFRNDQELLP